MPIDPSSPPRRDSRRIALVLLPITTALFLWLGYQNGLFALLKPAVTVTGFFGVDFGLIHRLEGEKRSQASALESAIVQEFQAGNPKDAPYYRDGLIAARLYASYLGAGDPYGLGLLQIADVYGNKARELGCKDPLIQIICDVYVYLRKRSVDLKSFQIQLAHLKAALASGYPAVCKLSNAGAVLRNLANMDTDKPEIAALVAGQSPGLAELAVEQFRAFAATAPSQSELCRRADILMENMDNNAIALQTAWPALKDVLTAGKVDPADIAWLQGAYHVDLAWASRGSGWASTVTREGWRGMAVQLDLAERILTEAAREHPDAPKLAVKMITVELGQGRGRARMEEWFQKAIAADPDECAAYDRKMYYLQPKWYGSMSDVIAFARTCVATRRWEAGIPMIALSGAYEHQSAIIAGPENWAFFENTAKDILKRYPKSIRYRTQYLSLAANSGKWEIAREQLDLLGDDWDRFVLSSSEYNDLNAAIAANAPVPP
ncbi:MAG TPA: hypothetical protein PLS03_01370 [Terrimicrobiaceae bacterium]|nr:hypothetical protein [Terrimicrobiaceae bacterium]